MKTGTASSRNEKDRPIRSVPVLVIDSSILRKHLFKGCVVLKRIAVAAHEGKLNLCVPWIIEQEVLSGIEEHVNELTGQEQFLASVRRVSQLSSDPESIRVLCDKFENIHPTICAEARRRFQHFLETSQAERPLLQPTHTNQVFKAYFTGEPPFDRPKNREHLPDAFIYCSVMDLTNTHKEVWFLGADGQLCESLKQTGKVKVYSNAYPLFDDLQLPFDYKRDEARDFAPLDIEALCESARVAMRSELRGQNLRYRAQDFSDALKIREVLEVRKLSVDRQSVMHLNDNALLIAFEADIIVRAVERWSDGHTKTERLAQFDVSMRGHFLAEIDEVGAGKQKVATVEMDDFEVGAMEKNAGSEILQSIPPQPKVVYYYQDNFEKIIQKEAGGLVVVIGSTARNRRLVTEYLIAARKKARIGVATLLGFRPLHETHLPFHDCSGESDYNSLVVLLEKAQSAELDALGLSSEDADWAAAKIIDLLRESDRFIVATMKSINSRSAVVRHLIKLTGGSNNLEFLTAVAWIQEVTPETITFAISEGSEWGDGSWEAVLERDEWLKSIRKQ